MTPTRVLPSVDWPVLELLFEPGAGNDLALLVRALANRCRPTAPDHTVFGAARLLSSPQVPESYLVRQTPRVPYAVVVRRIEELDHPVAVGATALVTIGIETTEDDDRAVPLSPYALRTRSVLPMPLELRSRMRRAHRLPEALVVTLGRPGAAPLNGPNLATALRLAAVANVVGPSAIEAMALATPVVTDPATAAMLGAVDGTHVVVAEGASGARIAADLAAESLTDPTRAAVLGRAGRRLVEQHHDADRTAEGLCAALGLVAPSATPAAAGIRLGDRLAQMGTPAGHPIELQLADRLAPLGVAPRTAGSLR